MQSIVMPIKDTVTDNPYIIMRTQALTPEATRARSANSSSCAKPSMSANVANPQRLYITSVMCLCGWVCRISAGCSCSCSCSISVSSSWICPCCFSNPSGFSRNILIARMTSIPTAIYLMNSASKSNQDLNNTYAITTAIDDIKCATAIIPELRIPLNRAFLFLAEYTSAIGQPCPGSSPCRSPIMATPMYAGFMRPISFKSNLIISFEEAGIQIKERFLGDWTIRYIVQSF